jgi:glucose/mannose-6-phosphate isomerase
MALEESIRRFPEQFAWEPVVEQGESLGAHAQYVVCGMGGSHMAAWLIQAFASRADISIHRDYGLPDIPAERAADTLVILSSHSGTTEEVLDAGREALARGMKTAAISTGGKLIEFAREHSLPHIVMPAGDFEPRLALGYSLLGIARLLGDGPLESRIALAGRTLDANAREAEGVSLGESLRGRVPLIYASTRNLPVAYIWKAKLNESAKIPVFCDAMPEMCHNELSGFDVVDSTRSVSANMHAVFLTDESDDPRNTRRMHIASEMLAERGIPSTLVPLTGDDVSKLLSGLVLADWVALSLARHYGVGDELTPMIAEFKRRIAL